MASRMPGAEQKKVPRRVKGRDRWERLWPPDAFRLGGDDLSLAWTNWPMLTVGMVKRGLPDDAVRKILGENVLRVSRATLKAG